jgi:hypothetical protein
MDSVGVCLRYPVAVLRRLYDCAVYKLSSQLNTLLLIAPSLNQITLKASRKILYGEGQEKRLKTDFE